MAFVKLAWGVKDTSRLKVSFTVVKGNTYVNIYFPWPLLTKLGWEDESTQLNVYYDDIYPDHFMIEKTKENEEKGYRMTRLRDRPHSNMRLQFKYNHHKRTKNKSDRAHIVKYEIQDGKLIIYNH